MSDTSKLSTCQMVCWGLASLTGLMVLLASTRSLGLVPGVMLGVAVAVVLGVVFRWLVCTDYPDGDRGIEGRDVVRALGNATGITGYKAPLDQASVMDVAMGSKSAASRAPSADAAVKSGTVLDGEQELAERKGEWRFDAQEADMNDPASASVDDMVGVRPTGLNAPRGGQADDLKQIKVWVRSWNNCAMTSGFTISTRSRHGPMTRWTGSMKTSLASRAASAVMTGSRRQRCLRLAGTPVRPGRSPGMMPTDEGAR